MKSRGKQRRQRRGSAWYWKQTDCWYYTCPGSKKRQPLFDLSGQRVRGKDGRQAAELALARARLSDCWRPPPMAAKRGEWLVARVCSEYLQYCDRGVAAGTISPSHRDQSRQYLNDLCSYCGALPVSQFKKGHVESWIEGHANWRSPATRRNVITVILAVFNYSQQTHRVPHTLKGLKKPACRPRLHSLGAAEERALYKAANVRFREFLFAAIHTGLRPFCELAHLTADDVEETQRGMMWRVYSSKTKKTRKLPVRPEVAKLTRRLIATAPRGSGIAVFRNTQGNPWKKVTGGDRFRWIKRKLGWDKDSIRAQYSCYSCRHTFAHRMLSGYWNGGAGCSIETLAELIGDTPKVAFDHYGREWGQHYQEPLWVAVGAPDTRVRARSGT